MLWSTFTLHIIHIMGWVGTVSSQMDWERLPVAPLYADVRAYCSHVKMYCKRARLLSSHPRLFIHVRSCLLVSTGDKAMYPGVQLGPHWRVRVRFYDNWQTSWILSDSWQKGKFQKFYWQLRLVPGLTDSLSDKMLERLTGNWNLGSSRSPIEKSQ